MRFSRRLKILEMTLDTFPDTGGRWASGRLLTSVPNPFSTARTSGKPRKENLLTLNNKSGRSFVPPSALSKYPTKRYKHPMGKHRACIDRGYPINNKSVRSARLLFGCPAFWRGKRRTNCYSSYSRQRWRKNFGFSCVKICSSKTKSHSLKTEKRDCREAVNIILKTESIQYWQLCYLIIINIILSYFQYLYSEI